MTSWTLFSSGTVVDGTGSPPVSNTSILVQGNLIHSVGPDLHESALRDGVIPRGDSLQVIDAANKTVMPGLIDAHAHPAFGEGLSQEAQDLYTSVELRTLRSAWNAKAILRAGVTSVSQPGSCYYIGVGLRQGVEEGIVEGPRFFTAGREISTSNGLTDFYPDAVGVPEGSIGVLANTPDEMRTEVRRQIKAGVDLIKMADSPFGDFQAFTDDEMKLMVDLTHQLKRKVTIHARGNEETRAAVRAGVDWVMHANIMDDETIDEVAQSGTMIIPVLTLLANWADFGQYCGTPVELQDSAREMCEKSADTYHRAKAAGVRFGFGSEAGFGITPCGEWHGRELELLMDYAGLSSLEAIHAGTQSVAEMVGLEGQVGTIAPGMLADIIVVDGDPVEDITVLQRRERIVTVMKDGRVIDFGDDERTLHPYEPDQRFQSSLLMYDTVYGDPERQPTLEPLPSNREEGATLADDLRRRERGAAVPIDEDDDAKAIANRTSARPN
ncbi:MAG: amidohydrolase family protein [Solirubrobacterales bacterium]